MCEDDPQYHQMVVSKKKLVENGAEISWVKEDVFGSNIFCSC